MEERIINPKDLTPVQLYNNIYFKRDDLYQPFDDIPISGSKVRQHQLLVEDNLANIKEFCDNNIYAFLFLSSCQSAVIARVAREYNIKTTIFHGGTTQASIMKNKIALNAIVNKAKINTRLKSGYASVLKGEADRLKKLSNESYHDERSGYTITSKQPKFFNASLEENASVYPEAVLYSTANQVQNLPDLDVLYVPIGSGLMCTGVLLGIQQFNSNIHKVVGINISGHENTKILSLFKEVSGITCTIPFEQVSVDIPYHKRIKCQVVKGFDLDSIYEAKAYKKMLEIYNPTLKNGFWVSGNMDPIRDKVYNLKETLQEMRS